MQPLMPLAQGERLPTLESQKREVGDGGRSLLKRRGLFAISEKQREADTLIYCYCSNVQSKPRLRHNSTKRGSV
jgi:hypothetical protein